MNDLAKLKIIRDKISELKKIAIEQASIAQELIEVCKDLDKIRKSIKK